MARIFLITLLLCPLGCNDPVCSKIKRIGSCTTYTDYPECAVELENGYKVTVSAPTMEGRIVCTRRGVRGNHKRIEDH